MVEIEKLSNKNEKHLLSLDRGDVGDGFVESAARTIALAHWGDKNGYAGVCFAMKSDVKYVGLMLFGKAILSECEKAVIKGTDTFRIMGFFIDKNCRAMGIGKQAFADALNLFYNLYGTKTLILSCHISNVAAIRFYERFGFKNTGIIESNNHLFIK